MGSDRGGPKGRDWLKVELRPFKQLVFVTTRPEALEAVLGAEVGIADGVIGFCGSVCPGRWAVYATSLSTLVHELVHACILALERAGVDPRHDSGEVLAYLQQDVLERVLASSKKRGWIWDV